MEGKSAMKESITNKRMLKVVFGFMLIGGLAAIIGIVRKARNTES
jgi:hypothetical protein